MAKVIKPKKATQAGKRSCFEWTHDHSGRKVKEVETTSEWREKVLWAMYAMAGGYMTKPQRERFHAILKKMVDGVWYPSLTEKWIWKGKKLKARVLGTSTARPVRSKLGPHGRMAVNEMKKRQVDWIKESGRAMSEMLNESCHSCCRRWTRNASFAA